MASRVVDYRDRPGGEQAANTLQPGNTSRHATTANAKVGATVGAFLLITRRPYLFSHGRGRHFRYDPRL
jgi:hypothetical protein